MQISEVNLHLEFGKRCTQLRKERGYTRTAFAEKLGIPQTTLRNYELGIHEPGHSFLIQVAKEFGVTTDFLVGLTDEPYRAKKSPVPAEPETGDADDYEDDLFYQALIADGRVREGEDITSAQLRIFTSVLEIIDAAFPKLSDVDGSESRKTG